MTEVNEIKDEIVSKDEPATVEISSAAVTLAEDKPAPEVAKDGANPPNAMGNSEVDSTPTPSVAVPAEVEAPVVVETPVEVAPEEKAASEQTTTVIHPVTSSSDAGKDDSQKADGKSKQLFQSIPICASVGSQPRRVSVGSPLQGEKMGRSSKNYLMTWTCQIG